MATRLLVTRRPGVEAGALSNRHLYCTLPRYKPPSETHWGWVCCVTINFISIADSRQLAAIQAWITFAVLGWSLVPTDVDRLARLTEGSPNELFAVMLCFLMHLAISPKLLARPVPDMLPPVSLVLFTASLKARPRVLKCLIRRFIYLYKIQICHLSVASHLVHLPFSFHEDIPHCVSKLCPHRP